MGNKLLGLDPSTTTAEEYRSYITAFYKKPDSKGSTCVDGISISWCLNRIIIRVKRAPKEVTMKELKKLAKEFDRKYEYILELFKKRKIKVVE